MGRKKWNVVPYDKEKAVAMAQRCGIDPFAALLLTSRGYDTPEKIEEFISAGRRPLSSPFLIRDMEKGVARIRRALERDEKILVYGDYDCDGVTATALLYSYLLTLTDNVDYYIPSRLEDGYGLSEKTAEKILEGHFDLVITVDNGIASIEEARFLGENGIDLIVTDHHQPGETLPDCVAVIDPHRKDDTSPCKELAGVGVAMKLCAALEDGDYDLILNDVSDILTIGTIADIVPLTGENRTIVSLGLGAIENTGRPGLIALKEAVSLSGKSLSSTSVAFAIAPKINAAGRMDSAETALELLITEDFDRAETLVKKIVEANAARQSTEAEILRQAEEMIAAGHMEDHRVLVVAGENWHPGVIGIVAARLTDKYGKPSAVISIGDGGECRGSARSIEGFSLYDALFSVSDVLTKFGGHTGAAGFGILQENIDAFREKINAYAGALSEVFPEIKIECRLVPRNISVGVLDSLSLLEPFGAENPAPLFGLFGMKITGISPLSQNKHIKLSLSKDGVSLTAPYFGISTETFPYGVGDEVDLAVALERNEFRGNVNVSIHVRDIRPAGTQDETLFASISLFHKLQRNESLSPEEKKALTPDRQMFEKIYTYVKNHPGVTTPEIIAAKAGVKNEAFGKVLTALSAFIEINVLSAENGAYTPVNGGKKNLTDSRLLQRLVKNAE